MDLIKELRIKLVWLSSISSISDISNSKVVIRHTKITVKLYYGSPVFSMRSTPTKVDFFETISNLVREATLVVVVREVLS